MATLQQATPRLVLASASPARAALLAAAGLACEQRPVYVDEALVRESLAADGVAGAEAALALASLKGERAAADASPDELIVAADQLLEAANGAWLDKPATADALKAQLAQLAGSTHALHTSVVLFRAGSRVWHHVASPRVTMRPLNSAFIDLYVEAAGPEVLGCVGGYQVEGLGAHVLSDVRGDFHAVQGLPLLPLVAALRTQGALVDL